MSERYPAISQLIAENRIPEFDALYVRLFSPLALRQST
jgi:5'-3' exonuclease